MRRAAVLAICGGLAALAPSPAWAGSPESLTVAPFVAEQGSSVDLKLVCQNGDAGPVSSPAFAAEVKLILRSSLPGYRAYTGAARIADSAGPSSSLLPAAPAAPP
ncbi:hypothetical protein [Crossiella sp. NPDC003009]